MVLPHKQKHSRLFLLFLNLFCGAFVSLSAQTARETTQYAEHDDVVFAIAFSPDEGTLAIARGASAPGERFGRIELWNTQTGKLRHVISGFDGPVRSIDFSPDGETIVSASSEYQIEKIRTKEGPLGTIFSELKWWNAKTGELKHKLRFPNDRETPRLDYAKLGFATYSPNGKHLAVAEFVGQATVSGQPVFEGLGYVMQFNRASDAAVKILDAETGELQLKIKPTNNQRIRAMFSPDGQLIATWTQRTPGGWNKDRIFLWDSLTGKQKREVKDLKGEPRGVAFSPDGKLFAVTSMKYSREDLGNRIAIIATSEIRIFDIQSWKVLTNLPNLDPVTSLTFSPDSNILMVGGLRGIKFGSVPAVRLLDLRSQEFSDFFVGGEDYKEAVNAIALSKSAALLAVQTGSADVRLFDTRSGEMKQHWNAESAGDLVHRPVSRYLLTLKTVMAAAFSEDGRTISGELDDGSIKWWDARTGELKREIVADDELPSLVTVAANGNTHAEVTNGMLRVWSPNSPAKKTIAVQDSRMVSAIALASRGDTIAVGTNRVVKLLETDSGRLLTTIDHNQGVVNRIEFSTDARWLATTTEDGEIFIWDTGGRLEKVMSNGGQISALRFSPDGRTLATASSTDFTISFWNIQTGSVQRRLSFHSGLINALAFSADSQTLASGGADRTVVIWDVLSGKSKRKFKEHDQTVSSLVFSPDGALLAAATGNAAVIIWDVEEGKVNRVLR